LDPRIIQVRRDNAINQHKNNLNDKFGFENMWKNNIKRDELIKRQKDRDNNFWKNVDYRNKMSILAKQRCENPNSGFGLKNMWKNPEFRKIITSDDKVSKKSLKQFLDPSCMWGKYGYGKNGWHLSPKAGKIYYRSHLELNAYKILDNDDNILKYETESKIIPYEYLNKKLNYIPDVIATYVNDSVVVIEIKPIFALSNSDIAPQIYKKIEYSMISCAERNFTFIIWDDIFINKYKDGGLK